MIRKQLLIGTACLLAGFVLGIAGSSIAQKATLDIGSGECRYTAAPDGQWYQKEYRNSVRTIDNCGSIGLSLENRSWTFGLHYASLGSVSIDAQAVTCPEDDCNKTRDTSKDFYRAECKPAFNGDNCAYNWASGGNAKGVLATAAWRAFGFGALGFDIRGGLYFHQLKYAAVVENVECRDNPGCWRAAITQQKDFTVRPVLGIGAKYEPNWLHGGFAAVTWDRFFGIGDHVDQMTAGFKGDTDRLMVWAGFPL